MTRPQRLILAASCAVTLAALLFPPFTLRTAGAVVNLGFGFLFDPPRYGAPHWTGDLPGSVDVPLLLLELVVILAVSAACWWIARTEGQS